MENEMNGEAAMPCRDCTDPTACDSVCQAFAREQMPHGVPGRSVGMALSMAEPQSGIDPATNTPGATTPRVARLLTQDERTRLWGEHLAKPLWQQDHIADVQREFARVNGIEVAGTPGVEGRKP